MNDSGLELEFYTSRSRKGSQAVLLEVAGKLNENDFPRIGEKRDKNNRGRLLPPKKQRTGAVVVNIEGGNTYAEKLREMRDIQKEIESKSIEIEAIKQTQQGNMVVIMNKKCNKLQELQELLTRKIGGGVKASPARNKKTLMLSGMDAFTTREEVITAINKALGQNVEAHTEVQPMRNTSTGRRNATIIISPELADKLIKMRTFKVVYSKCYIRERVSILCCHKCYEANHLEANCTGPDRRHLCSTCGKEAHNSPNCECKPKCLTCQDAGDHRTGTMACPLFRSLVSKDSRTKIFRRRLSTTTNNERDKSTTS